MSALALRRHQLPARDHLAFEQHVHRLLGPPQVPNEVVYYSVPAEPIDNPTTCRLSG